MGTNTERPMMFQPSRLAMLRALVMTITGIKIIRPPMVGVPDLMRCFSGTSSSIVSTADFRFNSLMNAGPTMSVNNKEVTKAPIERKVT